MATTPIYTFQLPTVAGDTGVWGGELNTGITNIENEIARSRVPFLSPTYNVGGTTTIDCNQTTGARVHLFTVSGASTLSFINPPSASFAMPLQLVITNGGAFVLTWPGTVTWLSGVLPTFKTSGVDIVDLMTKDAGATWFAALRGSRQGPIVVGRQVINAGTGAATTETTLHTIAVPGNAVGPSGMIRVTVNFATTGSASTKAINVKYGSFAGGGGIAYAAGQNVLGQLVATFVNKGATNSQSVTLVYPTSGGTTQSATPLSVFQTNILGTIDSTVAQNITVTGTTPNAADEVTANETLVEVLPG